MTAAASPELEPGRAYRTRDLRSWGANPTRLARRLVQEGRLCEVVHGLYYAPLATRFGAAPPSDDALLRAFLADERYVITGPPVWNTLGLGATAMFAVTLVYNTRRSGEFRFGGRRFLLRRVRFPDAPSAEWFVVDLLQHHGMAGVAPSTLQAHLVASLWSGRWDRRRLRDMAVAYGTRTTQAMVDDALHRTSGVP